MTTAIALPPSTDKVAIRKRRAHGKSRRGCGNCKLRRIKCDELKPFCKRCKSFGVSCSYDSNSPDLQPLANGVFRLEMSQSSPSINKTIVTAFNAPLESRSINLSEDLPPYSFTERDLETLEKFRLRTVFTIGTYQSAPLMQREFVRMAKEQPYVMHVVLTLTHVHDRYLSREPRAMSTTEAFHWWRGTVLYNRALSRPIPPEERDALWGTAALLGAIAFSNVTAKDASESWPLRAPTPEDMDWLRMSDGKKAVWKIASPLRSDSVFAATYREHHDNDAFIAVTASDLASTPQEFIDFYDILTEPTPTSPNPYLSSAYYIMSLLKYECNHATILRFLKFIMSIDPVFKELLAAKDPKALLLLAYWYAKVCTYQQWWIWRRAVIECQAICIYLEKFHGEMKGMRTLLRFPKLMCGLDGSGSGGTVAMN